ncbi:MAG: right-handed parallel beta-helix repeat-containing protein, partial [Promethearchaeota archaeon]
MRRKNGVSWIVISLVMILVLWSLVPISVSTSAECLSTPARSKPEKPLTPAGTPHSPIIIDGDANFSATALLEDWSGDGSSESPFIIDGLDIDRGGGAGPSVNISNTRVNFTVINCNLTGASASAGIYLNNVSYGFLFNNTCSSNRYGIYLIDSSHNVLANNTCTPNGDVGIYMYDSDFNTVTDNNCDDNANYGIVLYYCDSNLLSRNLCSDNRYDGIHARYAVSNTFANNTCNLNRDNGIRIYYDSSGNTISNNTCNSNTDSGIFIDNDYKLWLSAVIIDNTCSDNDYGIYTFGWNVTLVNNVLTDNLINGIYLECDESTVTQNSIKGSDEGIRLFYGMQNVVSQNDITESHYGMWVQETSENMISGNAITENVLAGIVVEHFAIMNTIFLNDISYYTGEFIEPFNGIYLLADAEENNVTMNYILHSEGVPDNVAIRDDNSGSWGNVVDRNWYEDYSGSDGNGDGYGDTPYPIPGSGGNSDPRPLVYLPHAPAWTEPPTNQVLDLWSQPFYYDLNATAPSPITWTVNDTSQFTISTIGVVESIVHLPVDVYGLNVSVANIYGLRISSAFQLTVREISLPEWIVGPTNVLLDLGERVDYALIATDESGIAEWEINDTANFNLSVTHLNVTGYRFGWHILHITNSTWLASGVYSLNVSVSDPYDNSIHAVFSVTVEAPPLDVTPPEWVIAPIDETLGYGVPFVQRVGAWDDSGIDHWWLDDTVHFSLDEEGFIRNATVLEPGAYTLEVRAFDPFDNYCSATMVLTVNAATTGTTTTTTTSTQPPDGTGPVVAVLLFTGIGGAVAIVNVIVLL